jgi:hypothetical protein
MTPAAGDTPGDPSGANARHAIQSLLHGAAPNGTTPEDCGPWRDAVVALYDAYADDGTPGVRRVYDRLCRVEPALIALIAGDAAEEASERPTPMPGAACPPLPAAARAIEAHAAPCAQWLDEYVAFASQAAPMTPTSFHEAAALFAAALAIARRLCVRSGTLTIYPNLYVIYIARSGVYTKTTGLGVLTSLLDLAGLSHLLLPSKMSPEALVSNMSLGTVDDRLPDHKLARVLRQKAFAAQRGWLREEASALFSSMKRDFNTELVEYLLSLYDGGSISSSTITRGNDEVVDPYLSFFGVSNPVLMQPHLANQSHWGNGLWSRFVPLVPGAAEQPVYRSPGAGAQTLPASLISGLRQIYRLFPEPLCDVRSDEKKGIKWFEVVNMPTPLEATLAPEVHMAWHAYRRAMFDLLIAGDIDPVLEPSYSRFSTHAIKVALLLAAMDADPERGDVVVLPAHFARAQAIVEQWRLILHQLWGEQRGTEESDLTRRIERYLTKQRGGGMTLRDLCQATGALKRDVEGGLDLLRRAGKVGAVEVKKANGRMVEVWRWQ